MALIDEQGQGRIQLQDVLSGLVEQVRQEDSLLQALHVQGETEALHFGAARGLLGLHSPRKTLDHRSKTKAGQKSPKKKKRKIAKELDQEDCNVDASDNSLVVTFFGQKVDLAQFTETTPLYVVCREWMRNSAETSGGVSIPGRSGQLYEEEVLILPPLEDDPSNAVYKLPDPLPFNQRDKHPRIPHPIPIQTGSLDMTMNADADIDKLKKLNVERWKRVKKTWQDASSENQRRYSRSIDLINRSYVPPDLTEDPGN